MVRSPVAGLGLVSVLAALVFGGYLAVQSFEGSPSGGDSPGGGSLVLRVSGSPGVGFSGNYTTASGSKNVSGAVGGQPTDYELSGKGVGGVNIVTANVRKQGGNGALKVEILEDGRVVQSQETNAANGSVSVTYSP